MVLDILVQSRRNARAAKRLLRKLLKKEGYRSSRDNHGQAGQLCRREEGCHAWRRASAA
jgi:transposase-like protein